MRRVLPVVAGVLLLCACSGPVVVTTPTAAPSLDPSPSATAQPAELAETAAVTAALVRDDGTAPYTSFFSTVDPELPAFFEDRTDNAPGSWMTRVACSSATGAEIAVVIQPADGSPVEFSAPCAPGTSIAAFDGPAFAVTSTYEVSFTSTEPAVAAIGLFRQ